MKQVFIFFIVLFSFSPLIYSEEVNLANGEWKPYLSEKLPYYGYASHIVTEAFKAVGIVVKYKFYPWARAEAMVKRGEIDGSVVWSITAERKSFAYFSETIFADDEVLFHLKARPMKWNTFEDLRGIIIGVPLGSKLGAWEKPINAGIVEFSRTPTIETGFRQLSKGRIDGFPYIKSVGYHLLRTKLTLEERNQITHAPKVVERTKYRLMLSKSVKKNVVLIEKFNQGLRRLRESGKLHKMEQNFYTGKYD